MNSHVCGAECRRRLRCPVLAAADSFPLGSLEGHRDAVWCVAFAPRGYSLTDLPEHAAVSGAMDSELPILVSASADRTVRVWTFNPAVPGPSCITFTAVTPARSSHWLRLLLFPCFTSRPRRADWRSLGVAGAAACTVIDIPEALRRSGYVTGAAADHGPLPSSFVLLLPSLFAFCVV